MLPEQETRAVARPVTGGADCMISSLFYRHSVPLCRGRADPLSSGPGDFPDAGSESESGGAAGQIGSTQNIIDTGIVQKGEPDKYFYMDGPYSPLVLGVSLLADPQACSHLLLGETVLLSEANDPFEYMGRRGKTCIA